MDNRISKLIEHAFELSNFSKNVDDLYWEIPTNKIEASIELKEFIEKNLDIDFLTLIKKEEQKSKYEAHYKGVLFKKKGGEYLANSRAGNFLFNYCIFLLKEDIRIFNEAVNKNLNLRVEGSIDSKTFSFQIEKEIELENQIFSKLRHPKAVKSLIRRIPHIMWYESHRKFIGLIPINNARDHAIEEYDYTNIKI